ncbi:MAG TPA: minor capsid protein [bacterium]|nr:minor capsid protein [bacterium]
MKTDDVLDQTDGIIEKNKSVFLSLYDFFSKSGSNLSLLTKDELPRNKEYERLLTKVLTYSYFLGYTDNTKKKKVKKNAESFVNFSFDMPYDEAEKYFTRMRSVKAPVYYDMLNEYAGKAFTISWVNSIETLEDIRQEFSKQMKDGFDPEKFGQLIQSVIESRGDDPLAGWHLDTVIRTNCMTAFSRGRIIAQKESGLPYWQYIATLDGRETELCNTLDGKVFRSDDPFWSTYYPPNHFNCRSTVVSLSEKELDEEGLEYEKSGNDYLDKSDLEDTKPGDGFQYSPLNSLDDYLKEKAQEYDIDPPKSQKPV